MNKERRIKLSKISKTIDIAESELKLVLRDEQIAYENLPEALQESDRGTDIENAIDSLEAAIKTAEEMKEHLLDAMM